MRWAVLISLLLTCPLRAGDEATYVAVFDFIDVGRDTKGNATVLKDQPYGRQLADSVRLKLRRQGKAWQVIDRLTIQDSGAKVDLDTDPEVIAKLLGQTLGAHVGLFGRVQKIGKTVRAEIACIDLRRGAQPLWTAVFTDDTERSRAVISKQVVEALVGKELWRPPEYGDETEPTKEQLGKPLNANGSFDAGAAGWDAPDRVSTFLVDGPAGRGKVLRVRTDLARGPWLAYRRALRLGQTDPSKAPQIRKDTSYSCVGALEGVHYRGEWIKATPGGRYWLTADICPTTAAVSPDSMFFPKVFVKGFKRTPHAFDGLPESSLASLGLTPEQFAALPAERRKALVAADAEKHPMRYVRECYRWYLSCRASQGEWCHFAAPFPPRGGLPKDVEFLQIQVYSYWPPGEYLWDNVHLYADPGAKGPLKEEAPRTPNVGKTSDVVEKLRPPDAGDAKKAK